MKTSFFAIALGLFIISCNYEKSSNGNIDQAYAKEDYAAVHGQHRMEMKAKQKAAAKESNEKPQATEVKDTSATAVPVTPATADSSHQEEAHH